jgi:hypothetical protein
MAATMGNRRWASGRSTRVLPVHWGYNHCSNSLLVLGKRLELGYTDLETRRTQPKPLSAASLSVPLQLLVAGLGTGWPGRLGMLAGPLFSPTQRIAALGTSAPNQRMMMLRRVLTTASVRQAFAFAFVAGCSSTFPGAWKRTTYHSCRHMRCLFIRSGSRARRLSHWKCPSWSVPQARETNESSSDGLITLQQPRLH